MESQDYKGGENFDLRHLLVSGKKLDFKDRVHSFSQFVGQNNKEKQNFYSREVCSAASNEVDVYDSYDKKIKRMIMFGSNNYLGLASHPHVCSKVVNAISKFGVGIGGPPLLNGYTSLHKQLEERLADMKHAEGSILFSSGYNANVGLVSLLDKKDKFIYDEYSHASLYDGFKMNNVKHVPFKHNDVEHLDNLLQVENAPSSTKFIGVEGIYSMDGDISPLNEIIRVKNKHNGVLIVDDAHGTGILGANGRGTAEAFCIQNDIEVTMGTFSKVFAVSGGFVAASKPILDYLRFFARSYMFSASLPPVTIAAVLAGLDVIEQEPELRKRLFENVKLAADGLRKYGLVTEPQAGIIALKVPEDMNIRKAGFFLHNAGIFLNSIEYPAVSVKEQRFRISIMATHTKSNIQKLIETIDELYDTYKNNTELLIPSAEII